MSTFLVRVPLRKRGAPGGEDRYLAVVAWDPYRTGKALPVYTPDPDEAFQFGNHTAAEVIAAWVGGTVVDRREASYLGDGGGGE